MKAVRWLDVKPLSVVLDPKGFVSAEVLLKKQVWKLD
jgi:hypothetical protein